jgi:hypothetical protein
MPPRFPIKSWRSGLAVKQVDGKGACVFATKNFAQGEVIGYFEGKEVMMDSIHSIHLNRKRLEGAGLLRYLGHSCEANAKFRGKGRWLYALRPIPQGAEITIDYLYTEPVISHPLRLSVPCRRAAGA